LTFAAVRRPETSYEENVGIKVAADILIIWNCIEETEKVPLWVNTGMFKSDYRTATVNHYRLEDSDMVIDRPSMKGRMCQNDGSIVPPTGLIYQLNSPVHEKTQAVEPACRL